MSTKIKSGPLLGEVGTARNSVSNGDNGGYMDPRPVNGISSTVILPGTTIDYAEEAFLIPHEAIRCEMLTFTRLLPYLNFDVHPWKAHYVREWLVKFFIPAVHEHHDLEEHLVFPYYAKLGVVIPDYMVRMKTYDMSLSLSNPIHTPQFHSYTHSLTHLPDPFRSTITKRCWIVWAV